MTTFIQLPSTGSTADFISSVLDTDSVALVVGAGQLTANLRLSAEAAGANQVKIVNTIDAVGPGLLSALPYSDTNSIDLSGTTSLAADLRLSATAAGAGFFKVTNAIDSGGLLTTIPEAATAQTGVITSTDWNKFNDGVTAITDGTFPGSGQIGEFTSDQSVLGAHGAATGVFESVLSRNLTAGVWRIDGNIIANANGANLTGPIEAAIHTAADGTGINDYEKVYDPYLSTDATFNRGFTVPPKIVSVNATTTYYLICKFDFDSGTPQRGGQIQAERIR